MIRFESEKHLEDAIVKYYNETGNLCVDGYKYQKCYQQPKTSTHGIPDLVFTNDYVEKISDGDGEFTETTKELVVVELKNTSLNFSHLAQILKYKEYFSQALTGQEVTQSYYLVVTGSPRECPDALIIAREIPDLSIYFMSINFDSGVEFNHYYTTSTKPCMTLASSMFNIEQTDKKEVDF